MAHCSQCGKDVGCGCNLISGSCATCYSKTVNSTEDATLATPKKRPKRVVYSKPVEPPPNTEFEIILRTQGLSKEQKIKRINDILEKARQQIQ